MSHQFTLSPELDSPYEVASRHLDALIASTSNDDAAALRNEATTRLHLVNGLLEDCLAWPLEHIRAEVSEDGRYVDYQLGAESTRLVVEAKREGVAFELPPGYARRTITIPALRELSGEIGDAIDQTIGYCTRGGVGLGVVTNGHQLIAFIGSRQDGVRPAEGRAVVFSSLQDMREGFVELWKYLSPPGVEAQALYAQLQRGSQPPPPEKLSARITNYPGTKHRNQLQSELKLLGDLFLEDLAQDPALEREFLEDAYCTSGELSQYALISKDILETRYNSFFSEVGDATEYRTGPRSGVSNALADVVGSSLSRRPVILLGDVGVGKTTFIRRLIVVEAPSEFEQSVWLYVDFGNEPALATEIEPFVRQHFETQLHERHQIDIGERAFVEAVYKGELERFAKGIYGELRDKDPDEYRRRELELLQRHLENQETHLKASLGHIAGSLRRQIVIFLDNVDQRPFQFQEQVFLIAQSLATTWPATVFVSLRPETFYRSRAEGTLAAYQPRVFTISPPRVDLVLEKRLEFAHKQLTNEGIISSIGSGVTLRLPTLDAYVGALLHSLRTNHQLTELLDNLSGGNVRQALNFLTEFVGSGHVDSEKIVQVMRAGGRYRIPVHEFLRALIYGDNEHYDPSRSAIANVFDVSSADASEHFLLPILLRFIDRAGDEAGTTGFVLVDEIFEEGQRLGFLPAQIASALERATDKKLLETNLRGLLYGESDRYRLTTIGAYAVTRLVKLFTYVDAMAVDIPVVDRSTRLELQDVRAIEQRLARADLVRRYLDRSFDRLLNQSAPFEWEDVNAALGADIESIASRVG